ncbi:MAG: hypothetical protein WAT17_03105 [Candidatus Saccharimonadales bacterium]|jgi:DNA/RNA-binding domain of Phe-tRNA-synthetase-like protein
MAWHEIFDDAEGVVGSQVAWIGVSFGGVEGCSVQPDEGTLLVQEGATDESGQTCHWLVITGSQKDIVQVVTDEQNMQRVLARLPKNPQDKLAELERIQDILKGMKADRGELPFGF